MNGNFQYNYRGDWNDMSLNDDIPFNDRGHHNYRGGWNDMSMNDDIPFNDRGHHYADDRPSSHHRPAHYADNERLQHRNPAHYSDKRKLTRQRPEHYVDKRHSAHQMSEQYAYKRPLPHQTPEDFADKRSLSHQKPEDYADNKCLPHRAPKHYSDKRRFPQQTPEDFADKKCLPHQTLEATIPALSPVQRRQSNIFHCKICHVKFHRNCLEEHNNGKKHRMLLLELREQSTQRSVLNGRNSRLFPNSSQVDPVVQPKKDAKSKKNGHLVENVSREAAKFSNKEVPAVGSKRKFGDNTGAKDRGFKVENVSHEASSFKQKNVLAESSTRKLGDNTGPKGPSFKVENVKNEAPNFKHNKIPDEGSKKKLGDHTGAKDRGLKGENLKKEAPILKHKNLPAERSKRKLMDNTGAKDDGSNLDMKEAAGGKYMKIANGIRRPMNSTKHEVNAKSSSVKSLVQRPGLKPPSGSAASHKLAPIPVEGSSFEIQSQHVSASLSQESKGKEHHNFQNTTMEKNDQPQSTPVVLNASTGSNMTDPVGSITNNQTEAVNSDSAAIKVVIEPLASALPDASLSRIELLTEHGLHTEIERQVSEAAAYHRTEEKDVQLLPSISMKIDALSEVSTETEDESSQWKVEMDDLVTESGTTKFLQIPVCLTCGDKGFEETLVSCNKCEACALHRYCLDGPVVFTDEVIWFCEDCEEDAVVTDDDTDSESTDSEQGEVDASQECSSVDPQPIVDPTPIPDPQPIADPIWRGSLQVLNKSYDKIITRLLCHLSTLACPKVLEETRHLPTVLYADLIQRSAVWPESFVKFGTNNLSIGLYFFPETERDERYFDQLVDEMISNDLAIRSTVEKAELLIFPSTMLPSKYKRFQSKYYLWGIFKRIQEPSKTHDAGSGNERSLLTGQ